MPTQKEEKVDGNVNSSTDDEEVDVEAEPGPGEMMESGDTDETFKETSLASGDIEDNRSSGIENNTSNEGSFLSIEKIADAPINSDLSRTNFSVGTTETIDVEPSPDTRIVINSVGVPSVPHPSIEKLFDAPIISGTSRKKFSVGKTKTIDGEPSSDNRIVTIPVGVLMEAVTTDPTHNLPGNDVLEDDVVEGQEVVNPDLVQAMPINPDDVMFAENATERTCCKSGNTTAIGLLSAILLGAAVIMIMLFGLNLFNPDEGDDVPTTPATSPTFLNASTLPPVLEELDDNQANNPNSTNIISTEAFETFPPSHAPSKSFSRVITPSPTSTNFLEIRERLFPVSGEALYNISTPQYQALYWVHEQDQLQVQYNTSDPYLYRQRYFMALLHIEFQGDAWISNTNWMSNLTECAWEFVACDDGLHVDSIDLGRNGLRGTIPTEFGILTKIVFINIQFNDLYGTIPDEIYTLDNLEIFTVFGNWLTGTLSTEVGSMAAIKELWLGSNKITGTIPTELGNLVHLEKIILMNSVYTGNIPTELGRLKQFLGINIENNLITGIIPTQLGAIPTLDFFGCTINLLSGIIPVELSDLSDLTYIYVAQNFLVGEFPMKNATSLEYLDISNNTFTGVLPSEIGLLTSLRELFFENNLFTGTIPPEIGVFPGIDILATANNNFYGTLPEEMCNLTSLRILDITNNTLTGSIPECFNDLQRLEITYIRGNDFTGTLPDAVCLNDLVIYNVDCNIFTCDCCVCGV